MGIECKVIVYGDGFFPCGKKSYAQYIVGIYAEAELLGLQFNPVKDHPVHLTRLEALGLKVDGVTSELHSGWCLNPKRI